MRGDTNFKASDLSGPSVQSLYCGNNDEREYMNICPQLSIFHAGPQQTFEPLVKMIEFRTVTPLFSPSSGVPGNY